MNRADQDEEKKMDC